MLLLLSRFSRVWLQQPHGQQPTRLPRPWDPPGKNTGVGCHFLLQCMKGTSESEVAQSCPTLCDPMDCSPLGSSVHGIFQARALEWGAIALSTMGIIVFKYVTTLLCEVIYAVYTHIYICIYLLWGYIKQYEGCRMRALIWLDIIVIIITWLYHYSIINKQRPR